MTLASFIVVGLVIGTLAGAVALGASTPAQVGSAELQTSAGGPPSGNHGACVVSAVNAALQSRDPGTGIGWLVHAMARKC